MKWSQLSSLSLSLSDSSPDEKGGAEKKAHTYTDVQQVVGDDDGVYSCGLFSREQGGRRSPAMVAAAEDHATF